MIADELRSGFVIDAERLEGKKMGREFFGKILFGVLVVLGFPFFLLGRAEARDPKVDEMPDIQQIAYFLQADASEIYSVVANQALHNPDLGRVLNSLENLNEKSANFYSRAIKDSSSPWRGVSSYQELNQAFEMARNAFIEQAVYVSDPRAFEEIAFLMGALLQYYYYSPYESYQTGGAYSYQSGPVYPRNVYSWLPSYYNFSACRFSNSRAYPWGRSVFFGRTHR